MLLYFADNVPIQGIVDATLIEPHPVLPLIASVWANPSRLIVTDVENELIAELRDPARAPNEKITALVWHPSQSILAVGWSTGRLSSLTVPESAPANARDAPTAPLLCDAEKAQSQHDGGGVTTCVWSSTGAYLLTASRTKHVGLWMLESSAEKDSMERMPFQGAMNADGETVTNMISAPKKATNMKSIFTPMWSVVPEGVVTHAVHVTSATTSLSAGGKNKVNKNVTNGNSTDDEECLFILSGNETRTIWGLSEELKLFPLVTLDEPLIAVVFEAAERHYVTMSAGHVISVYHVTETMEMQLLFRRKLSTPSPSVTTERFTFAMLWAAPGLLAFCCGDNRVRFYDIHTDSMFFVRYPGQELVHVTHIATFMRKGLLVMATAGGPIAVFQCSTAQTAQGSHHDTSNMSIETHATRMKSPNVSLTRTGDPADQWELLTVVDATNHAEHIQFTAVGHIVVALGTGKLQILRETVRRRAWDGVSAAIQISMDLIVVESVTGCQCTLRSSRKVRGLSIAFPNIAVWDGRRIDLYTINEATSTSSLTTYVDTTNPAFAVHREGIFFTKTDANRIVFANFQLLTIGQLAFTEDEGAPKLIDVMDDVIVVLSTQNAMRIARVSGRDVRTVGPPRRLQLGDEHVVVTDIKINAQGRRVALMCHRTDRDVPDCRVWVYDSDLDQTSSFDFALRGEIPTAVCWNTPEPDSSTIGELGFLLLACETHQMASSATAAAGALLDESTLTADANPTNLTTVTSTVAFEESSRVYGNVAAVAAAAAAAAAASGADYQPPRKDSKAAKPEKEIHGNEAMPDLENFAERKKQLEEEQHLSGFSNVNPFVNRAHNVVTLFSTNKGLVVHNSVELKRYHICLIGLTIPDFLLASIKINGNPANTDDYMIEQKRLRDFEGLKTEKDAALLEALMKFSYYSTIGSMDEAYRCVKTIKNPKVWQSVAKMCVSSGRLDVADVCLAQMQDGVAARALREVRANYPTEKNVQLATLACSLGLVKECEDLLRRGHRYDLITDLLMACGKFDQAQRHVRRFDRIRQYPVAYKYAQFLESLSNFDAAALWYYNARCIHTDVARIYFQNNRLGELHDLVLKEHKKDPTQGNSDKKADHSNSPATTPRIKNSTNNGNPNNNHENGPPSTNAPSNTSESASVRDDRSKSPVDADAKQSCSPPKKDKNAPSGQNDDEEETASDKEKPEEKVDLRATFEKIFYHNRDLLWWWAKHSERRKNYADALNFYTLADDTFNIVRLLCDASPPRIEEATELVNRDIARSRDRARQLKGDVTASSSTLTNEMEPVGAAYFVGRHHERLGDASTALEYYVYAGAWRAAAKVAKAHNRDGELFTFAVTSDDTQLMLSTAVYMEQHKIYDKAVELYHKIGDIQKAIDVCIKGGLYDTMHRISTTLDARGDPAVFLQMASHFVESQHYSKAAEMFIFAREFNRALELCTDHGVPLTDSMAESITSDANKDIASPEKKKELLIRIAGITKDQGNWNVACKCYTQVGDRLKAIKMLMRGGDVNKVIFFANHSRNAEIYTMAANFLQSQNWHSDPTIYKSIINFYTKAKAFENLISFADACAQMHIDEDRNYSNAWQVLNECALVLEKSRGAALTPNMSEESAIHTRRDLVAQVIQAQKLISEVPANPGKAEELISVCSDLIKRSRPSHPDHALIAAGIRIGDVFALLVRYYQECAHAPKDAVKVLESMVKHGVCPKFFVDRALLQEVCTATGRKTTDFESKEDLETR